MKLRNGEDRAKEVLAVLRSVLEILNEHDLKLCTYINEQGHADFIAIDKRDGSIFGVDVNYE